MHGHLDTFNQGLAEIYFNNKIDRIISVGDLVDRVTHCELHRHDCL
ncbi:hypothetical protein [Dasania marina]